MNGPNRCQALRQGYTVTSLTQFFNFSDSSTALCVVRTAVIGGGVNRTVDRGSEKGQEETA